MDYGELSFSLPRLSLFDYDATYHSESVRWLMVKFDLNLGSHHHQFHLLLIPPITTFLHHDSYNESIPNELVDALGCSKRSLGCKGSAVRFLCHRLHNSCLTVQTELSGSFLSWMCSSLKSQVTKFPLSKRLV